VQARTQLQAIIEVLAKVREVKVFDQSYVASQTYCDEMRSRFKLNVHCVPTVEEAAEADILVTTTPSRNPIILKRHVGPGTHINAIGADAQGKHELESSLLKSAKIIVDDIGQATHSGEVNVPLSQGVLCPEDIYGTLGEIVLGMKRGRESEDEITIFDSTGLAVQDIACAHLAYSKAKSNGACFKLL